LIDVFGKSFESVVYVFTFIWPYLIVIAFVWIFWKIGRSFFR
jgi:hypothetical protein